MDQDRIAELLAPFLRLSSKEVCHSDEPRSGREESAVLSPTQLQHISTYIDLLQRWNARVNLTAIRNEEEIVTRHFGESLFAARHLFPLCSSVSSVVKAVEAAAGGSDAGAAKEGRKKLTVADVGSGAGFPGIPIKLWAPEISLTLIESNQKKATFLREVARALTLTDINIQNSRAESLDGNTFDVVTLRAVERFETVLPSAARLLTSNGRIALLIGAPQVRKATQILPSLAWTDPLPVPLSGSRVLAIGQGRSGR